MLSDATFTPCFDWVVRATGNSSAALAYGVIWRYAQMRGAYCYASCERLSAELGWTRQRIMRHIQVLLSRRLVRCINPDDEGVPHAYVPVTEEEWAAPHAGESGADEELQPQDRLQLEAGFETRDGLQVAGDKLPASSHTDVGVCSLSPVTYNAHSGPEPTPFRDAPCGETLHPPVAFRHGSCDEKSQPPVPFRDTPCHSALPQPVTLCDTRNTIRNTNRIPERARPKAAPAPFNLAPATCNQPSASQPRRRSRADPRTRLPAIQLFRQITGALPPIVLYDQVLAALGPEPSEDRVRPYYQAWCARGYNPRSLTWLLEWYTNDKRDGLQVSGDRSQAQQGPPAMACNLQPVTCNRPRTHNRQQAPLNAGPPTSADEFARWREYQQSVQNGDDPDETKRRLGL